MKLLLRLSLWFVFALSAGAQHAMGERFDEELPDPILASEEWLELPPGEVYRGYFKLPTVFQNNWPLSWQLKGDHIQLHKLHQAWFQQYYFNSTQQSRIYDPQGYLSQIEKEVLEDILKNHEKVSKLPIHLFILGAGQQLFGFDVVQAGQTFLQRPNSALMFYYMDQPKVTTGYVKTFAAPKIPGNEEDEKPLLDPFLVKTMFTKAGIHAAGMNQDTAETLYATVSEVSRRMYWIEHELGLVTPTELEPEESPSDKEEQEVELSVIEKFWAQLGGNKQNLLFLGSGILLAMLLMIAAFILMSYRRVKSYHFPNYTGPTRLKAQYGAGVSEVVAFKDPRVSLSDQKKRIEDSEL